MVIDDLLTGLAGNPAAVVASQSLKRTPRTPLWTRQSSTTCSTFDIIVVTKLQLLSATSSSRLREPPSLSASSDYRLVRSPFKKEIWVGSRTGSSAEISPKAAGAALGFVDGGTLAHALQLNVDFPRYC
jgi:hypothetical protein